jgi:6,7-dimethyl-8-ribityllumazine synthase
MHKTTRSAADPVSAAKAPFFGELSGGAAGDRLAIVVSRYHIEITQKLLAGALDTLRERSWTDSNIDIVWVPGAWEIPLPTQQLAASGRYAAVICLGAVIRGETSHDQHINRFVTMSLGRIGLRFNVPVALGVLTCHTESQAQERAGGSAGNKGSEAAAAALEMIALSRRLAILPARNTPDSARGEAETP